MYLNTKISSARPWGGVACPLRGGNPPTISGSKPSAAVGFLVVLSSGVVRFFELQHEKVVYLTPLKPLGWRGFKIFIFMVSIWMAHIKQIQFFNDYFMDSNLCRAWIAFALLSCLRLPAWLAASNRVIQWMEYGLKGKLEIELGYLP